MEAYAAQLAAGDAEVLAVLRGIDPYTATTTLGGKGRVWNVNIWALTAEEKESADVSNRYITYIYGSFRIDTCQINLQFLFSQSHHIPGHIPGYQ